MKKTIFSAAILSAFLAAGSAMAQQSDTGTPNTVHGSGDMMQDGPHASSNPNADAEGNALPSSHAADAHQSKMNACEKRWKEAQKNGAASNTTRDDFINNCMHG